MFCGDQTGLRSNPGPSGSTPRVGCSSASPILRILHKTRGVKSFIYKGLQKCRVLTPKTRGVIDENARFYADITPTPIDQHRPPEDEIHARFLGANNL